MNSIQFMKYSFIILFFVLLSKSSSAQVNLSQGLVAYYPFEGNANNVVSNDLHGVTHGNIQLTKDRFGRDNHAYLFDGTNSNIIVAGGTKMNTPAFSVCYYFKTNKTNQQVLTGKIEYIDGIVATFNTGIFHQNSDAFFGVLQPLNDCNVGVPSTYNYTIFSPPAIRVDEWYCVVNTFENGIQRLYLNGELVKEEKRSFNNAATCSKTDFIIGSWWQQDPWWFSGVIDDVRYYNRAINAEEVKALCLAPNDSMIINDYAAVLSMNNCQNGLVLDDATAFNVGDTVLLMQMKGSLIDSSNSSSFGQITSYGGAGNYEMNIIRSKSGNGVILENIITRDFDYVRGKVQLVRVPYFTDFIIDKKLTALPWNGAKGGVVVLMAAGTVIMNENIDVTGKGFRSGKPIKSSLVTSNMTGYFYNKASNNGGEKGEGISEVGDDKNYGRGALANGGGGGNAHNAGGGGGGNGGSGGTGGDQYQALKTIATTIGGEGGKNLINSAALNRLFAGGAGGMGQGNDLAEFEAGNGGGIIIIAANTLVHNSFSIKANGENAVEAPSPTNSKDGMSGGGAGGSILLDILNVSGSINIEAKGGKGADQPATMYNGRTGPGGGGGGGMIGFSQTAIPGSYTLNLTGGVNGTNTGYANDPWHAQPGQNGVAIPNMQIARATVPFKPNIDSVRINDQIVNCLSMEFAGISTTQNHPIISWQWDFGDNQNHSEQNADHVYGDDGDYLVKLKVEDAKGCKDSITKQVSVVSIKLDKSKDAEVCLNSSVKLFASGGSVYNWFPTDGLDNPAIAEPTANPNETTKYFVTVSKGSDCTIEDSVLLTVNPLPVITKSADTSICYLSSVQLSASGGTIYAWKPDPTLNNPSLANPIAMPTESTTYHVEVTDVNGCRNEDSVQVTVFSKAQISVSPDTAICKNGIISLAASGGQTYAWYPDAMIETSTGPSVSIKPLDSEATFYVDITDNNLCQYTDSVRVSILPEVVFQISRDTAICQTQSVQLTAVGGDEYQWLSSSGASFPKSGTITVSPENSTSYSVLISENACGKRETLTTTVNVYPNPTLTINKSNDISCKQPIAQLKATGTARTFEWTPDLSLDNPRTQNPKATPKQTTTYYLKARDQNSCVAEDSITIYVSMTDKAFLALPNAFTPNGDGLNDCFGVPAAWGSVRDLNLKVYNRFGQMVFQTNDPAKCWDGTFKGEPQNAGVFAYTISANTACEIINFKGSVVLIR